MTHEGFGYGKINNGGVAMVDFTVAVDLTIVNSRLRRRRTI